MVYARLMATRVPTWSPQIRTGRATCIGICRWRVGIRALGERRRPKGAESGGLRRPPSPLNQLVTNTRLQ